MPTGDTQSWQLRLLNKFCDMKLVTQALASSLYSEELPKFWPKIPPLRSISTWESICNKDINTEGKNQWKMCVLIPCPKWPLQALPWLYTDGKGLLACPGMLTEADIMAIVWCHIDLVTTTVVTVGFYRLKLSLESMHLVQSISANFVSLGDALLLFKFTSIKDKIKL